MMGMRDTWGVGPSETSSRPLVPERVQSAISPLCVPPGSARASPR